MEYEKDLEEVFYSKKFLFKSLPIFTEKLKQLGYDIPFSVVKNFYENQAITQIFKPIKKQTLFYPILSYYPFERVYMDTMYLTLDNSTIAFYNIIDHFSKYAFSNMFNINKNSSAIPSSKAKQTFENFYNKIKDKFKIGFVYTDRGNENQGELQTYLESLKIPQIYSNVGDKSKLSPIERFNKTLRLYIEKYKFHYGRITKSALNDIINSYNDVPHSDLHYSPDDILNNQNIQLKITNIYLNKKNNLEDYIPLEKGSFVRVLLQTNTFSKVKPNWSSEIYKVKSNINNTYELDGIQGLFKEHQLQAVDIKNLKNKNVKFDYEPSYWSDPDKK